MKENISCIEQILRSSPQEQASMTAMAIKCYYNLLDKTVEFQEDMPLFVLACDLYSRYHKDVLPMDLGIAEIEKEDKDAAFRNECLKFVEECKRKRAVKEMTL